MSSDRRHWPTLTRTCDRYLTVVRPDFSRAERLLWTLVAIALVADLLTTYYGLRAGLAESNPIARVAIERFGFAAMLGLKLFAVGVGLFCRRLLPGRHTLIVPTGLAVPWLAASVINLSLYAIAV